MAQAPARTTLKAGGMDVYNAIWNEADTRFQQALPYGTVANSREIGGIITQSQYQWAQNDFIRSLVNRIGRVIITSKLYYNPWAPFKKGMMEFGDTVEELFVELAKVYNYDPVKGETETFKRHLPDVRSAFHQMNYQKWYPMTISNDQLRQAFLSWQGVNDLIGKIVDSIYTSANLDEFVTMKYLLSKAILAGQFYPVSIPTVETANMKEITSTIKGVSNEIEFMDTTYNYAKVHTFSEKQDQFLISNASFDAKTDVEVLSAAFNMDKAEFMGHRVMVNSFSFSASDLDRLNQLFGSDAWYTPFTIDELNKLKAVPAVLIDRDWFMVFDDYYNFTENYSGVGLYWNYNYHTWKTVSQSPFANAIVFTTETPAITSVTVAPSTVTLAKGAKQSFTAAVVATGFAPQSVTWSITGADEASTVIDENGTLYISPSETATEITVTATSTFDSAKTGTSTVTVSA